MAITYAEGLLTRPTGLALPANRQRYVSWSTATGFARSAARRLESLNLAPKRTVTFTLAYGTPIPRAVAECHLALPQDNAHTPVILDEST